MPRKIKKEASNRAWDLEEIQELIDLMVERDLTEFELEKGGVRVRIQRGNVRSGPGETHFEAASSDAHTHTGPPPTAASSRATHAAGAESRAGESAEGLHLIKSPIVGTYYSAPAPNAPPFVKLGDKVEVGHVLCIIEAMKLMNEIESDVAGEVVRTYVESGHPVEYGQSLFAINPSQKK